MFAVHIVFIKQRSSFIPILYIGIYKAEEQHTTFATCKFVKPSIISIRKSLKSNEYEKLGFVTSFLSLVHA